MSQSKPLKAARAAYERIMETRLALRHCVALADVRFARQNASKERVEPDEAEKVTASPAILHQRKTERERERRKMENIG